MRQRTTRDQQDVGRDVAVTRQPPPYAALLARVTADVARIAADVEADLAREQADLPDLVRRFLAALATAERLPPTDAHRLEAEGAGAARAGIPLHERIDAYLTTAWVAWNSAASDARPGEEGALAALGAALLRAGDDAAAALAKGYTAAERSLAARGGAIRRAVLDELLALAESDPAAVARVTRRAALAGLQPAVPYRLIVVQGASEVEDEGSATQAAARLLARVAGRRSHLAAVHDGALVALLEQPWPAERVLDEALDDAEFGGTWWAVAAEPAPLAGLGRAYADARDALRVVRALDAERRIVTVTSVALERALVADIDLAQAGVDRWLGPLAAAPRGGAALIRTLDAYFAAGESVAATARMLGLAPRTVSYRLERVAELLGIPALDAEVRLRLATALLARRLLRLA